VLQRFSTNFTIFSIAFDSILVSLALRMAVILRPWLDRIPGVRPIGGQVNPPFSFYLIFPIVWVVINFINSLYDAQRNYHFKDEVFWLGASSLLSMGAMAGILFLSYRDMSRVQFIAFVLIACIVQLAWRMVIRIYWRRTNHTDGYGKRNVLILGAGVVGTRIAETLHNHIYSQKIIVHYLDDDPEKQPRPDVLGPISALGKVISSRPIDDIILTLPLEAHEKVIDTVIATRIHPIQVWVVPAAHRLAIYQASIENFFGIPLLGLRTPAILPHQRLVKRLFDICFSATFLFLSAPLFGLIALIVRLDSPGPIFFRQKRIGENGRPFEMIKFRTMVQNAEALRHTVEKVDNKGNLVHKHRNDPRITRAGRFLRRFSLDEFPQFINVLRGDMSVVGPRPELPYLVKKYDPWQYVRFTVPQGVTGWWQVNGRSDKPMHLNTEEDIYYIKNYSFWFDLQIILRTLWVLLRQEGAF
jgi:exopolysaccharide biosynthesis polyprenyl glycosylphosphotransferase